MTARAGRMPAVLLTIAALAQLPATGGSAMAQSEGRSTGGAAPARPGHYAELEELEAARRAGTRAAYDLFLARHPESRYAPIARREREKLPR